MSRVAVAGAGVAGRLTAWRLARLGHEVDVFDLAPDGAAPVGMASHPAAGFTAAGMLSPLAELENAPPEIAALGWRSLDLWPGIVAALAPAHRTPVPFRRNGSVLVAHPRDAGAAQRVLARMKAAQARTASPTPTALDAAALHELEPALAGGLHAWMLHGEGQVDPTRLLPALCADAPRVRWHWGAQVLQLAPGGLQWAQAQAAPRSERFDIVVDTRGLGAREALPLRGIRGELLWLHAPAVTLRRPVRCIHARHRVYLVPRHGDLVIVGATEIDSEDRSPVSVRSAVELLSAAHSIVPELAEARIVRLDTHLRPATPDQRPHLHCEAGLIRINGLFRHGFLLAPALVDDALVASGLAEGVASREIHHA